MELALPKLLLGFKEVGVPHAGEEFVLHDLVSEFAMEILFGKSSDTYQELYDERLILDDFGASYGIGAGIGYGIIGGDTPEPERLRDILLERIRKLVEGGIRGEDFEREKRKFIGGFIRGFNSLEYIASHYTYFLFHGFDLFRSIDLLSKLDRDGLEARVASLLNRSHSSCFMLVPR
jgi:predicted Zn-dependent peptidase